MDSPVEAGEVADEVRRKGGAPAEGDKKNIGYGMPRHGGSKHIFVLLVIRELYRFEILPKPVIQVGSE